MNNRINLGQAYAHSQGENGMEGEKEDGSHVFFIAGYLQEIWS